MSDRNVQETPKAHILHAFTATDCILAHMARTTYTVTPFKQEMWKVEANGRIVSKHRKKRKAVQRARELRDRNDTVTIMNRNGRFQKRI